MPDPGTDPHFVIKIIFEGQNIFNRVSIPSAEDDFIVRSIKGGISNIIGLRLCWQAMDNRKFIIKTELLLESEQVSFALKDISSYIQKFCVDAI